MQAIQKYLCIFVFTSMIISAELSMYIITHVHWYDVLTGDNS